MYLNFSLDFPVINPAYFRKNLKNLLWEISFPQYSLEPFLHLFIP